MNTIDIAVAAAYALLCIALISLLNPYTALVGTNTAAADARASTAISGYVQAVGLPFLSTASPSQFCTSLQAASSGSMTLGGSLDGYACPGAPEYFSGTSTLSFTLGGNQVEIQAWAALA